MAGNLAAVFDLAEPERSARLRELRLGALLLFGRKHPLTAAAGEAIADPQRIGDLLDAIDALPAIPKRRLLATLAAILPTETAG